VSDPDVSVVLPTRDRYRFLNRAVTSALAQTGVQLEVLVVDDASTDATNEMMSQLADPRVRYVRKTVSEGVSAARNTGISEAKGRWIAFLDDDDVWSPDKLARQVSVMDANGTAWSFGGDVAVDSELNILGGGPPPSSDEVVRLVERHNSVPAGASNVVVSAEALAAAGPFDIGLTNSEDWDMWIRLARAGPPDSVSRPLVAITYHDGNASRNMDSMLRQLDLVAKRYGIRIDRARHLRWAAWHALLEGRRADAARYYARAAAAGDIASLGRIAVAIVDPGFATRRKQRGSAGHDSWIAQAREWLEPLKDAVRTS
jgi:glycosyltransferase involved in cell wall biosynthesis